MLRPLRLTILSGKATLMRCARCGAQQQTNTDRRFACYAGVRSTSKQARKRPFFAAAEAEENTQTHIVNGAARNAMQHAADQADRELVLVV